MVKKILIVGGGSAGWASAAYMSKHLKNIEIELRRPACIFEGGNVAISRRISERWRLIGAGIVG